MSQAINAVHSIGNQQMINELMNQTKLGSLRGWFIAHHAASNKSFGQESCRCEIKAVLAMSNMTAYVQPAGLVGEKVPN
jgi:hypothetical protein